MKCRIKAPGCFGIYERWTGNIMRSGVCQNPNCLLEKARMNKEKAEAKKAKLERIAKKVGMDNLKTTREILKEAQVYCNRAALLRHADKPCITCGKSRNDGKFDAGHCRPVGTGANWAVRFHPANIRPQCVACNQYRSGMEADFKEIIAKIYGQEMLDYLYNAPAYTYSREDAIEIKEYFMAECLRLRKT